MGGNQIPAHPTSAQLSEQGEKVQGGPGRAEARGSAGPASAPQGGRGWQRREAPPSSVSSMGRLCPGHSGHSRRCCSPCTEQTVLAQGGPKRPGPQPLATYPRPAGLGPSPAGGRDVMGLPSVGPSASISSWRPSEGLRASGSSWPLSWGRRPRAQSSGLTPGLVPRTRGALSSSCSRM